MRYFGLIAAVTMVTACSTPAADSTSVEPVRPVKSMMGLTLGTPTVINLYGSYYFDRNHGVRLSGAYLPVTYKKDLYGAQLNLLYRFHETQLGFLEASALAGVTIEEDRPGQTRRWRYAGIGLSGRWFPFFAEVGFCHFGGEDTGPGVTLQVGLAIITSRHD